LQTVGAQVAALRANLSTEGGSHFGKFVALKAEKRTLEQELGKARRQAGLPAALPASGAAAATAAAAGGAAAAAAAVAVGRASFSSALVVDELLGSTAAAVAKAAQQQQHQTQPPHPQPHQHQPHPQPPGVSAAAAAGGLPPRARQPTKAASLRRPVGSGGSDGGFCRSRGSGGSDGGGGGGGGSSGRGGSGGSDGGPPDPGQPQQQQQPVQPRFSGAAEPRRRRSGSGSAEPAELVGPRAVRAVF